MHLKAFDKEGREILAAYHSPVSELQELIVWLEKMAICGVIE